MKIVFLYAMRDIHQKAGGTEKVLASISGAMAERGHEVFVVCHDHATECQPFFAFDSRVSLINLDGSGRRKSIPFLKLARELIKPLRRFPALASIPNPVESDRIKDVARKLPRVWDDLQPDVIIPFYLRDAACVTQGGRRPPCPMIVMLHDAPEFGICSYAQQPLMREALAQCTILQVLVPSAAEVVRRRLSISTVVIPNAVPQFADDAIADLAAEKATRTIRMISRIDKNKQQRLLVEAFARIARQFPDWNLAIFGGHAKAIDLRTVKNLIQRHAIESQVFLHGPTDRAYHELRQSDIFAFPSLSEGFPLALTEAMSIGLPCVGLRTTLAVNELIIDGVNGLLADNTPEDLADKLRVLMEDRERRIALGQAAHKSMKQYAPEKVWDMWERLIRETIAG